jgi:hypothetical protein
MNNFDLKSPPENIWKRKVPIFWLVIVLAFASFLTALFAISANYGMPKYTSVFFHKNKPHRPMSIGKTSRPIPPPVSMSRLKKQGCIADGLLSQYSPGQEQYIDLINRSNCYYLHRAVETWLTPPDFETIEFNMNSITKKNVVYGMFIAEAIKTNAIYLDKEDNRNFDFGKMCQTGSEDVWGTHTCKPDFGSGEYRSYLKDITHQAIDLGIQSFTFGQIYFQEGAGGDKIADVVKEMRAYAKKKKVNIIIGAQTGKRTDPVFLSLFDYIEGGTGIDENGNLPSGPCLDRWGGCWPLLWDRTYSQNAKNVLIGLDWSGITSDDLDIFARMDKTRRTETLRNLYNYFTSKNMGFMMPFFGVLDKENGGCYGPKKRFYSPDNLYTCQDEDAINKIIKGG